MTTRKYPHESQAGERRQESAEPATTKHVAALEGKVAELEATAAETKERYLRIAADFDNFKKRARQEQADTIQHASAELINRLLPGLDDLHKALEHKPAGVDASWLKGVELSVRKLEEALGAHGLEAIDSVGSRFDPKLHEAVGHEESTEHPEDTVVSELRRGYRIHDRVVRPSLVKLARRPALPADGDSGPDGAADQA
ncbi:MAG TPA: nucleotide exchange factor GrpE [Candidatus Dormibacteraeota bacterium]|nr:nucleotide exchange factor GrpE [Candidatus Dormibacteraeota bacterium]